MTTKKEKHNLCQKKYYHTNKEYRDSRYEYGKNWRHKNKEKVRGYRKKWREKNKEKKNEIQNLWRRNDIERQREYERNRRIKEMRVIHAFILEDWKTKLKRTSGICPRCKEFVGIENLTLDHNPPLSKVPEGFIYTIEDINPLCRRCNSQKGNKIENSQIHIRNFIKEEY